MESDKAVRNGTRVRQATIAAALVATACWSPVALGRTQPDTDCAAGASLDALSDPAESLVLVPVDHVPTVADVSKIESIHLEKATSDTGTPLLNLAPRVNDTLREVFDGDSAQGGPSQQPDVSSSPVADHEDVKNLSEITDEARSADDALEGADLPLLRRQMYRIDI